MQDSDNFPRLLQSFFSQRLIAQRRVSPHTIASYRDTFRLLLQFAKKRLHKEPSQLELKDFNASLMAVSRSCNGAMAAFKTASSSTIAT